MDDAQSAPESIADRRAAQVTELRRLANVTDNMLAVWQALALHLGGRAAYDAYDPTAVSDGDMVPIPAWCAQYLLQCALNLNGIADDHMLHNLRKPGGLSPEAALEVVPRALALSGSGWNAFKRAAGTWEMLQDWRMYREAKAKGKSSTEAVEIVRLFRNLGSGPKDHRAAARRISNGRKLEEQMTKPHP